MVLGYVPTTRPRGGMDHDEGGGRAPALPLVDGRVLAGAVTFTRKARQVRGEHPDARRRWFAPGTWPAPWRVSRLPWRGGAGAAARVA
jgi:hypothetical protein